VRCGNGNATIGLSYVERHIVGVEMQGADFVERYRCYAATCVKISRNIPDPAAKLVLLAMTQSWLKLAEQIAEPGGDFRRNPKGRRRANNEF